MSTISERGMAGRSGRIRRVAGVLIVLAVATGCGVPDRQPTFPEMKASAIADQAKPGGEAYISELQPILTDVGGVIGRCIESSSQLNYFELVMVVDGSGLVIDGQVLPGTDFSVCTARELRDTLLPEPPFAPFHAYFGLSIGVNAEQAPAAEQ